MVTNKKCSIDKNYANISHKYVTVNRGTNIQTDGREENVYFCLRLFRRAARGPDFEI